MAVRENQNSTVNRRIRRLCDRGFRAVRRLFLRLWMSYRRVVLPLTYKARLIFGARVPGILNWDAGVREWQLPSGQRAVLTARHVGSLGEATEFHVDVEGFATPDEARVAGEKLRGTLRLVNAVLGLGLHVPSIDQEVPRARLAPHLKEKIADEYGAAIVDCVFGLNVLRDGEEFELAVRGVANARPENSDYVLEAASQLWGLEDRLDDLSKLACELLNSASRDPSPRSAYMIAFLALDMLMERRERPKDALQVLGDLQKLVDAANLPLPDKQRLRGFLGAWRHTSLEAELDRFATAGANAGMVVEGELLPEFLKSCLKLRHRLSHPPKEPGAPAIDESELVRRGNGLRYVVLAIVWARSKLPAVKFSRPGDVVQISEMKISVL